MVIMARIELDEGVTFEDVEETLYNSSLAVDVDLMEVYED